jgi:hypothetical protein
VLLIVVGGHRSGLASSESGRLPTIAFISRNVGIKKNPPQSQLLPCWTIRPLGRVSKVGVSREMLPVWDEGT